MAVRGLHSHIWLELQNHGWCGRTEDPTLCYVSSGVMWLEVRVHSDPGCSFLSSVVLRKLLNLLVANWSQLYHGDNMTACLLGSMCGLKEIRVIHGTHSITVS